MIYEYMKQLAEQEGYEVTDNAPKIAKVKERFFGVEHWKRCPCDPDSDRFCISEHCKRDIQQNGVCHCNAYRKQTNMKG